MNTDFMNICHFSLGSVLNVLDRKVAVTSGILLCTVGERQDSPRTFCLHTIGCRGHVYPV